HFAGSADVAELLGQLQQTELGSDDLLHLGHFVISVPPEGGSRSQLRVRTAPCPPAPLPKPTTTVRLNASYYTSIYRLSPYASPRLLQLAEFKGWRIGDGADQAILDQVVGPHRVARQCSGIAPQPWDFGLEQFGKVAHRHHIRCSSLG